MESLGKDSFSICKNNKGIEDTVNRIKYARREKEIVELAKSLGVSLKKAEKMYKECMCPTEETKKKSSPVQTRKKSSNYKIFFNKRN
jgi:hypothetical protein